MLRKLLFLSLFLSSSFLLFAQVQQIQTPQETLLKLPLQDMNHVYEIVKQLSDDDRAILEQVLLKKTKGNFVMAFIVIASFVVAVIVLNNFLSDMENPEFFDDISGLIDELGMP